MTIIAWKDSYATGIGACDQEHQVLVARINELYEAIRNQETGRRLPEIVDALTSYTSKHFQHEEQLMTDWRYPGLEEQMVEHAKLRARVAEFRWQLEDGDAQVAQKLLNFLREWLLHHIVEVDMRYAGFLAGKGLA